MDLFKALNPIRDSFIGEKKRDGSAVEFKSLKNEMKSLEKLHQALEQKLQNYKTTIDVSHKL